MILLPLIFVVTAIYLFLKYVYSYWDREGFPYLKPSIPFGNLVDVIKRKTSFGINIYTLYKASTEPFSGIYLLFRPALLVRDADLVKNILTTDFNSFHDRGVFHNPSVDPLSGHLFNMPGKAWKTLRASITPSFTTGKLKSMMSTILGEGEVLKTYLKDVADKREVVKMKNLIDRFAMNIIGSVGFGFDIDVINNPEHEFVKIDSEIVSPDMSNTFRFVCAFLCPSVLHFLGTYANLPKVQKYFIDITSQAIEHREKNNIVRKDFMQLLLQLRNNGKVSQDGDWDIKSAASSKKTLTIEECAAQTFLFYIAGFDTSASTLTYCLYELIRNKELKEKVQREIDETLERHNNEITYDAINEMKYLELCILETVRKYPTLPFLNRICTVDYKVPNSKYTIKKGTPIIISLMGMGRDPNYFPDPEKFIPERFAEDDKNFNEKAMIPFGDGPRACVGLRLGKMIAKVGLIQLLKSYDFEILEDKEIEFDNYAITLVPLGGVEIRVVNRKE